MPIPVTCSSCSAKLSAPDAAAGQRIRCPKCRAVCPVPALAFEVVDDPAPEDRPRAKRPAPADAPPAERKRRNDSPRKDKRSLRDAKDAEDAERPEGQARRSPALLIAGLLVGALLLAGTAFAVFWFGFRARVVGPAPETVQLNGWEEYTSPAGVFKASFPGQPVAREWKPIGDVRATSDIREHLAGDTALGKPSLSFFAGYVRFPDGVTPAEINDAKKWLTTLHAAPALSAGGKTTKKVAAGGREWDEERMTAAGSTGVVRWHLAGPTLHLVGYRAENQAAPADAVEQFFAAHQVLGGDPGNPDPDPVKPEGWQPYTSPDGAFRAEFPGEATKMSNFHFDGAKAAEFRRYSLKDDRGRTHTYFAGYVRFADKPTFAQAREVKEFVRRETVGNTAYHRRLAVGGWPWGEELRRRDPGESGVARWVVAGPTIYAAGIKAPRLPADPAVERFFGAFEVLGAKPDDRDRRMPPDWAEYRAPGGEFRTALPRGNAQREDDPFKIEGGTRYAGVPLASLTAYRGSDESSGKLTVYVVRFRPDTAEADRLKVLNLLARRDPPPPETNPGTDQKVSWAGRDAVERTFSPKAVARITHDASAGYVATAMFDTPSPELARVFLDNFSFDRSAPPLVPAGAGSPPGWTTYKAPAQGFQALMPTRQGVRGSDYKPSGKSDLIKPIAGGRRFTAIEGTKTYNTYIVIVVQFVPGATADERQAALNEITSPVILTPKAAKLESRNKITWHGREALEHVYTPADLCVCRQTHTETTGYVVAVVAQGTTLDAEKAKLFLDSFTFDKD